MSQVREARLAAVAKAGALKSKVADLWIEVGRVEANAMKIENERTPPAPARRLNQKGGFDGKRGSVREGRLLGCAARFVCDVCVLCQVGGSFAANGVDRLECWDVLLADGDLAKLVSDCDDQAKGHAMLQVKQRGRS